MYNDNKAKPLHIMLPKTSAYVKSYDGQTKWVYFLIEDDDFFITNFFSIWGFPHNHSKTTGLQGKGEDIFLTPH